MKNLKALNVRKDERSKKVSAHENLSGLECDKDEQKPEEIGEEYA